jgi:hypothetical protein
VMDTSVLNLVNVFQKDGSAMVKMIAQEETMNPLNAHPVSPVLEIISVFPAHGFVTTTMIVMVEKMKQTAPQPNDHHAMDSNAPMETVSHPVGFVTATTIVVTTLMKIIAHVTKVKSTVEDVFQRLGYATLFQIAPKLRMRQIAPWLPSSVSPLRNTTSSPRNT